MRHIGIDFGKKRVGVALSDEAGNFALPHSVFSNDTQLVPRLAALAAEQKVGVFVMGESKDFQQRDNPIMKAARAFKEELEKASSLPVYLEPEFMTSAEAEHLQGKNAMLDASAAALILKSYLEKHRAQ